MGRTDMAKRQQVGIDIQNRAVIGHPVPNSNANKRHLPVAHPHSRLSWPQLPLNAEIIKHRQYHFMEAVEVILQSQSISPQGNDRVDRQLTRHVEKAAASAVDPPNWPAP